MSAQQAPCSWLLQPDRATKRGEHSKPAQSPGFTSNPSMDPIQHKLHSTLSPLPCKICRRTRRTRKILFFPCSSLRVKAVWEGKRILCLLYFFGACQPAVQSPAELVPDTGDLNCSIQHTLIWGSRVTELNFIKNGTEMVMNCDEEEIRVLFPLTTALYMIPESPEPALCIPPSLALFI